MTIPYVTEPLVRTHDRAAFTCGVSALDHYLRVQARQDMERYVTAVFVLRPSDAPTTIAGYYSLSAYTIQTTALPAETTRRLPRHPNLPATLLGRLAVDVRYQKQSIGAMALISALRRSLNQSHKIGSIAVVVDAKDERARSFYERYDFLRFADHPLRLYLPMATIAGLFP